MANPQIIIFACPYTNAPMGCFANTDAIRRSVRPGTQAINERKYREIARRIDTGTERGEYCDVKFYTMPLRN